MAKNFTLKPTINFGKQSLKLLEQIKGSKALIVTDSVMEKLGYLGTVTDYLNTAGIDSVVFDGIRPDPDINIVANGMKIFIQSRADVLIAIGGGSAIDTAKGILYFTLKASEKSGQKVKKPFFISIPSTSGTGSEVTDFSVITSNGEKVVIVDESIAPDMAILDSACIQHVPKHVIADTGIDVLVHAIEAYVSLEATDFTDALAEKSAKLIFEYLEKLYNNPEDDILRDHIQNASCMAGIAFTNANLGINHSLAHALGSTFHISHGRSNALLLNAVIEFNSDLSGSADSIAAGKYAKLASILNLPARTKREGIVSLLKAISDLKKSLKIENSIKELGLENKPFEDSIEHMCLLALNDRCTKTNPKVPSKDDFYNIYKKCF